MAYIIHDKEQYVIWGIGETVLDAWADMLGGMSGAGIAVCETEPDDPGFAGGSWTLRSNYEARRASGALLDAVRAYGGNLPWGVLPDGTAGTQGELDQ